MPNRRRSPFGATVTVCALCMFASPALGGAVCDREDDSSATKIASGDARPSEWIVQILGERYVAAKSSASAAQDAPLPDLSYTSEVSEAPGSPRAAVIPLPAPLWSGITGLSALAAASLINKIRKLL